MTLFVDTMSRPRVLTRKSGTFDPSLMLQIERFSSEGFFMARFLQDVIGSVTGLYFSSNGNVSFRQRTIPDFVTALSIPDLMASDIREQSSDLP